ncbi:MAG: hypothetical protein KC910_23455, partial [Candidatus Eremiobacteraeota bacterium]|nr:hypothetical protein [Candidatus Eremiobacteraeota bacterium]
MTNLTVSRAGSTPAKKDAHALYRQMEAEGIGAASFSDLYVRGEAPAPTTEAPKQAPMPEAAQPVSVEAEAPAGPPSQTFEVPPPTESSAPAAPAMSSHDWYRLMENQGLGWAGTNDLVVPSQPNSAPSTLTELDVTPQPDAALPPVAVLPEVPDAPKPQAEPVTPQPEPVATEPVAAQPKPDVTEPVAPPAEELPPVATLPEVPVAPKP